MNKFNYIYNPKEKIILQNAYSSITSLNLWNWMKIKYFSPKDNSTELRNIDKLIQKHPILGHTHIGYSRIWVLRQMKFISIYGLEEYQDEREKFHTI